jgi:hypothetical protein
LRCEIVYWLKRGCFAFLIADQLGVEAIQRR